MEGPKIEKRWRGEGETFKVEELVGQLVSNLALMS